MTSSELSPAVFLDRDGTINTEVDYLADPAELVLLPGAADAIRRLNESERPVIVVTNQSGVARGLLNLEDIAAIHARLDELLAAQGARVDAYYTCPHHPELGELPYRARCACRKPAPGMLLDAAAEHGLDLARSWMVGDSRRDVEAGLAAGTRAVLVLTGKPERLDAVGERSFEDADLAAAVERVLASDAS